MKKYLQILFGVSLVCSLVALSASPAISSEIQWEVIPGTHTVDPEFGEYSASIGTNTITSTGNAINFDYVEGAENTYARFLGNCRTGWVVMIASGYYDNHASLVINDRTRRTVDSSITTWRQALRFACSQ